MSKVLEHPILPLGVGRRRAPSRAAVSGVDLGDLGSSESLSLTTLVVPCLSPSPHPACLLIASYSLQTHLPMFWARRPWKMGLGRPLRMHSKPEGVTDSARGCSPLARFGVSPGQETSTIRQVPGACG